MTWLLFNAEFKQEFSGKELIKTDVYLKGQSS